MKLLFVLLLPFICAQSSFASQSPVLTLTQSKDFTHFLETQSKDGFRLESITDSAVKSGEMVRCLCDKLTIILTARDSESKTTRECSAVVTGFDNAPVVSIDEQNCITTQSGGMPSYPGHPTPHTMGANKPTFQSFKGYLSMARSEEMISTTMNLMPNLYAQDGSYFVALMFKNQFMMQFMNMKMNAAGNAFTTSTILKTETPATEVTLSCVSEVKDSWSCDYHTSNAKSGHMELSAVKTK
jgi:hypothetical protein